MGKVVFTNKATKEIHEYSSTQDSEYKVVRDLDTNKVKRASTSNIPPVEVIKPSGKIELEVVVASMETEDKQLLHQLYKLKD